MQGNRHEESSGLSRIPNMARNNHSMTAKKLQSVQKIQKWIRSIELENICPYCRGSNGGIGGARLCDPCHGYDPEEKEAREEDHLYYEENDHEMCGSCDQVHTGDGSWCDRCESRARGKRQRAFMRMPLATKDKFVASKMATNPRMSVFDAHYACSIGNW
jgi:hypothetical protein